MTSDHQFQGQCACSEFQYRLLRAPFFVHCCHCTWCQRETGSAFVLNGIIENDLVQVVQGRGELVDTPSASGRGQRIMRCARCRVALWSHYTNPFLSFVRLGTLDHGGRLRPDIHIYTSTKVDWLQLDEGCPVVPEYYDERAYWPPEAHERFATAKRLAESATDA